jgi:hypothetical protein
MRDDADNIGAAARLQSPGQCTAKAHHFDAGNRTCNCGGLTRGGSCTGWSIRSKLTSAEIEALILDRR